MKKLIFSAFLTLLSCTPTWAAPHAVGPYAVTRHVTLGGRGGWDYLSLDTASHRLFIARNNRVMVVDARTGKLLAQIPGMQHAHGVALVPTQHRGYVSNGDGNDISVINTRTFKVLGHIAVSGKDPDAIIVDPASGHIIAMDGDSNEISVVDPLAGKEVATITVPGNPEFAVTDGRGNLWVNLEDAGTLAHIDLNTDTLKNVWSLAPCKGPTGLAFDPASRRLFSVCANGLMMVTNADNGHRVAQLAIGKHPDAVAYDASLHNVLSSSGEGVLNVIHQEDADHYRILQNLPTRKSARTLALDPVTHQIFLVGAKTVGRGKPVHDFGVLVVGRH